MLLSVFEISIGFTKTAIVLTSEPVLALPADETNETPEMFYENRFSLPTNKGDEEVIRFFEKFQQSVERNDKRAVASLLHYPVCVRFSRDDGSNKKGCRLLGEKSFLANYDNIFDKDYKQFVLNISAERKGHMGVLWANWRGVTADRGQFWFEGICLDKGCEKTELKFTTLSSGFLQRPYNINNHID